MDTILLEENEIEKAVQFIKNGEIIAMPTETVYGLVANLNIPSAINDIYNIKNRPKEKFLPVSVFNLETAKKMADFNMNAIRLAEKFWPGPLTLIVKNSGYLLDSQKTVALRSPKHKIALKILEKLKFFALTSANFSGCKATSNFTDVFNDFNSKIAAIIKSKGTKLKPSSTIVDVSSERIKILRSGKITKEQIIEVIGFDI